MSGPDPPRPASKSIAPPPRGSPALTLGFLAGAFAATLGIAEGAARLVYPAPVSPFPASMPFLQDDPRFLWSVKPDQVSTPWRSVQLRTNHLGLRDDDATPYALAPGVRVLSVGDSTTWGFGVSASYTYTERLATLLGSAARPVDAINAGVPAWSLWQVSEWVGAVGLSLHPDVVLVYTLQNDFLPRGRNPRDPFHVSLTDRQMMEARQSVGPLLGLLAASRLDQILVRRWLVPTAASEAASAPDVVRVPESDRREAIDRLASRCREAGATLVLVHPVYDTPTYDADTVLAEGARRNRATYVDLPADPAFAPGRRKALFGGEGAHPNAEGHGAIAVVLAGELAKLPVFAEH